MALGLQHVAITADLFTGTAVFDSELNIAVDSEVPWPYHHRDLASSLISDHNVSLTEINM